jgi:hypothetical protein
MIPARALAQPLTEAIVAWDPSLLLAGLLLAGTLLVGAVVIALAGRWRRRPESPMLGPNEQLAHFRLLYEQGALSQEEFDRVRTRLNQQLRQDLNVSLAAPVKEVGIQGGPGANPPVNGPAPPPQPPQDGSRPT